ncbi:MAG TPA: iron-containing redox enzyme family protein [Gemmatimonadales bacterium]|nr:iron-containing redox enzyme family protein [Gemmatimonadales bacterium]
MIKLAVNRLGLVPSFNDEAGPSAPGSARLSARQAFYLFVNVEEHPEALPLAYDLVTQRLETDADPTGGAAAPAIGDVPGRLGDVVQRLSALRNRFSRPWRQTTEELTRRQVLHYFTQYMPTAFVDGCWLQSGVRVGAAQTPVGASFTALYAHQIRAFIADPGRHFVGDYRAAYARLGTAVEEVSSRSFSERGDFEDWSFLLPAFLLAIAQFMRSFPAEILGLHLAWQFLDLSSFGPALIRDLCEAYGLPSLGDDLASQAYLDQGREMARKAALQFLEDVEPSDRDGAWKGLVRGVNAGVAAWVEWFERTQAAAPTGPPDPRQEMIDLLWRKAPHASGYHADKTLGEKRIDEHLDATAFDGPAILAELARSRWVKPGRSDRSGILRHLVKFGGPMLAVFSPVELQIIQNWIDSLPTDEAADETAGMPGAKAPTGPSVREPVYISGRAWDATDFRRRSDRLYGRCTVRELFYYVINAEFFPDILPIAERFARDRLERSLTMLRKGERPIPSWHYDPEMLERWVYKKHRDQVDSYRPPGVRPPASREEFVEVTVQLAPIILIDGGWLQGIATPALIHTLVGRMLFHVLVEEIGAGNADEHHANVYRKLLAAMGEDAPPVDSWEFARWPRLKDSSFEVPALWLTISCFPRHFLPEILGLNLAVELAGIGGPYMEARDVLRGFGYPTLFVDVHNAADNVSAGHSAWAMNAIKRHMDDVAQRDGPHNVDPVWHRVWSGVRATLPQIGRMRMAAHRIGRRLFGEYPSAVPLIFPS